MSQALADLLLSYAKSTGDEKEETCGEQVRCGRSGYNDENKEKKKKSEVTPNYLFFCFPFLCITFFQSSHLVLCSGTDIHSCTYFDSHHLSMLSTEIVVLR